MLVQCVKGYKILYTFYYNSRKNAYMRGDYNIIRLN